MRIICALFSVLLLYAGCIAADGGVIEVELKRHVEVDGVMLSLSDVSIITGGSTLERKRLSDVELSRVPRVGYTGNYSLNAIKSRVTQEMPGLGTRLHWKGESVVRVKALGKILNASEYVRQAKRYLIASLLDSYDEIKVETHGIYKDLLIPNGDLEIKHRMNDAQRIGKRVVVWSDFLVDGLRVQTIPVWFKLESYGYVYTIDKDVARGTALNEKIFTWSYRDLSCVSGTPLVEIPEKSRMRFKVSRKLGDVVVVEDLEESPDVSRGDSVEILSTSGEAQVRVQATALQDGVVGQLIRVQHGNNGIKYLAKVIGPSLLSVDGVKL